MNQSNRRPRRSSQRRSRKPISSSSIRNQIRDQNLETLRTTGPFDPCPTTSDVAVKHKFTVKVTSAADGLFIANGQFFANLTPHVATAFSFDRFRVLKISAFAPASAGSFISAKGLTGSTVAQLITTDEFNFIDYGTQGSRRPVLHIIPNLQVRQTWFPVNVNVGEFFQFQTLPSTEIILQVTLELRTPPGTTVFP